MDASVTSVASATSAASAALAAFVDSAEVRCSPSLAGRAPYSTAASWPAFHSTSSTSRFLPAMLLRPEMPFIAMEFG